MSSYIKLYTIIAIMQYIAIFEVAICNITNRHIVSALVCTYVRTVCVLVCYITYVYITVLMQCSPVSITDVKEGTPGETMGA